MRLLGKRHTQQQVWSLNSEGRGLQEGADRELVSRCLSGDWSAFEALVSEHQGFVYGLAYRLVGNHQDADSVVQDAFFKAYRGLTGFDGRACFKTWLCRIAVRTSLDVLRRRRSRPRVASLEHSDAPAARGSEAPDKVLEYQQLKEAVGVAMEELPGEQRAALTLVAVEQMSYREAAAAMACSEGTLAWRIARARERLWDMLGPVLKD